MQLLILETPPHHREFSVCKLNTCSATQSRCPVYLFFILLDRSSKFFFTGHQPNSKADFAWRVNHVKRLILTCLQRCCFSCFGFVVYGGLLTLQPGSLPPPWPQSIMWAADSMITLPLYRCFVLHICYYYFYYVILVLELIIILA